MPESCAASPVEAIVTHSPSGTATVVRSAVPAKTPTALNQPVQISLVQHKLHFFHPTSQARTGRVLELRV